MTYEIRRCYGPKVIPTLTVNIVEGFGVRHDREGHLQVEMVYYGNRIWLNIPETAGSVSEEVFCRWRMDTQRSLNWGVV